MMNIGTIAPKVKTYIEKYNSNIFVYDVNGVQVVFLNTIKNYNEYAFCGTIYNKHCDDRGLPHLTEHCIFGGSKNFNIKEPFEYLVQNEKYTYLNAITFRDRTTCLFSSYEEKSFDNILDVYLDAIFNPLLKKSTFEQECYREKVSKDGEVSKNGIAFNEMLEMYSDKDYELENEIVREFSKNFFQFNAHGKPSEIAKTTNDDVVNYYNATYTNDNIQLSFYGDFNQGELTHEKILAKICDLTKDKQKTKLNATKSITPKIYEYECNTLHINNELHIVISCENDDIDDENANNILLKSIFTKRNISNQFKIDVENFDLDIKVDNNCKSTLVNLCIKSTDGFDGFKNKEICSEVALKFINESISNLDDNVIADMVENINETIIQQKTKDYGYKTQGIFNLIEISKFGKDILIQNILAIQTKNSNELEDFSLVKKITKLIELNSTKFSLQNIQNLQSNDSFVLYLKKIQEKYDKLFKNSTKYDIIDIIIIIKFNNLRENCVKSFKINGLHDFKNAKKLNVINQNTKWLDNKNSTLYANLRICTDDLQTTLGDLNSLLQNNSLEEIFQFHDLEIVNKVQNKNILDLITVELDLLNKTSAKKTSFKTKQIVINKDKADYSIYLYNNEGFVKTNDGEITVALDYVKSQHTQRDKALLQEKCKSDSSYDENIRENKLYKNILVLNIDENQNINYFYIELLLEALLNEKLNKIIRLKNGAYEVNYKLFKLDNKVVIYSNTDKYSFQTLEIFKQELNNLNDLSLSQIKKYLNKLTNNFYRNEQNKNIKIYKDFVNYLTKYSGDDLLHDFKIAEAVYILKNSEIVLEKSYI